MNFLTGHYKSDELDGQRHHANARRLVLRAWRPPLCGNGQAHTYAPWAGFLCLMVLRCLARDREIRAQAAWNNPDLVWITMRGMVNWTCNVFLPVYAVLQLLHGFMLYAGSDIVCMPAVPGCGTSAPPHCAWHCPACCGWREWFIAQGLGGIS